jgi:3-deoxy-D-manno-octulosonic-acid transferase
MPKGSHNIIEPLALGKPVVVGPETWTIEYPAEEAIAAGVCRRVAPGDLAAALAPGAPGPSPEAIRRFLDDHAGAVGKTLAAIDRLTGDPGRT